MIGLQRTTRAPCYEYLDAHAAPRMQPIPSVQWTRVSHVEIVVRADAKEQEPKLHQYRKWLRGIGYIRDNRYMALNEGIEEWLNADEPPD